MKNAWFIAWKDLKYTVRQWEASLWLFVMPIVFFYFIGTAMGGFTTMTAGKTKLAVAVPEDAGFLADEVIRRLEQNDFEITRPETEAAFQDTSPRLSFPSNFTEDVLAGNETALELTRKESGFTKDYDEVRAGSASFTVLADLAAAEKDGRPPTPEEERRFVQYVRSGGAANEPSRALADVFWVLLNSAEFALNH